jgi:pyrroloquinoline quinone biosynthesis protein E
MISKPQALIAEVTHRCPLHCVYCSNPLELAQRANEMTTADWERVLKQASDLGVLHLHLTGGEPLARPDLTQLIRSARQAKLYVNLITSGIGLTADRLQTFVDAGLDHIQLSMQGSEPEGSDEIAGARVHARKIQAAALIRQARIAFTLNVVVHRQNLDRLEEIITLAEQLQPEKLEIANVQYYGWAFRNRERLLPTREQVERSLAILLAAQERLKGRMRIDFVLPDYYAKYPKPCMGGWGQGLLLVDPAGRVLPCHAASVIPDLQIPSARERNLDWIWFESPAFNMFRGDAWMEEPCRSCDRKTKDFGGCRCQAFLLTSDPRATDPTCSLAPQRSVVNQVLHQVNNGFESAGANSWLYRVDTGV